MPSNFQELEEKKAQLLAHLEPWPEDKLTYRPGAGSWSAVQVLDHLAKTESTIQDRMRDGFLHPHRIRTRDRAGNWFLQRVFASDRKVKVPASADAVLPDAEPLPAAVKARWNESRTELAALLQGPLPASKLGVFRHPVAGWMTLDAVLAFFSVHIDHHMFQIHGLEQAYTAGPRHQP